MLPTLRMLKFSFANQKLQIIFLDDLLITSFFATFHNDRLQEIITNHQFLHVLLKHVILLIDAHLEHELCQKVFLTHHFMLFQSLFEQN